AYRPKPRASRFKPVSNCHSTKEARGWHRAKACSNRAAIPEAGRHLELRRSCASRGWATLGIGTRQVRTESPGDCQGNCQGKCTDRVMSGSVGLCSIEP